MEGPNEDFKGFENEFSGFPKHLPDDCVEYCLYVIDSKLQLPKEILSHLEAVRREALKLTDNLLKEYIWQRESFRLDLESGNGMLASRYVAANAEWCNREYVPSWHYKLWRLSRR
jgi:hypothetical protein